MIAIAVIVPAILQRALGRTAHNYETSTNGHDHLTMIQPMIQHSMIVAVVK
jgi:hypothetical protein